MPLSRGFAHNTAQQTTVEILTSDPKTRTVEGILRDGGKIQIAVWQAGAAFRWPQVGETWSVIRENNIWWRLGERIRFDSEQSVENMEEGELRLDSAIVTNSDGSRFLTEDDITLGGDKNFVFIQGVPSDTWIVNHTLDKFPSVSVVDSAGSEVIGDVTYINSDTIHITFGSAFSGKAYLN